ncbi:uncharacterized protein LOC129322886 isoform X2 [Prosopis cineraria]|uniref:uncharacterized protein LOC129322886 isoform X2 n=1 Tax=Prosopis cineraria TaxID=364024 RepID=UPI00241050C3|nr:uncharacterized protein LOC129322886 isoform X2 [Prosopis cineraria]
MTRMTTTTSSRTLLLSSFAFLSSKPCTAKCSLYLHQLRRPKPLDYTSSLCTKPLIKSRTLSCYAARRKPTVSTVSSGEEGDDNTKRVLQIALWIAEGIYIGWLFLLPFAPGDPVWAISKDTINSLVGLSLNFFFILPFSNFDRKRNRYKGSLDVLWGLQMFLTNTFLIPYMAIRLNDADDDNIQSKHSQLGAVMTKGAPIVGIIGGAACLLSLWWALYGRMDANFGGIAERWDFLLDYLGSERLAYAFIWDICLYIIFQPWLIQENLQNVQETKVFTVKYLSYVPVVGLIAYLLCLDQEVV